MALIVEIGEKSSVLGKLVAKTQSAAGKMKSAFAGVGAKLAGVFGASAAIAGTKALVSEFARLGDLADRLGTTGEEIQQLSQLAAQGGADVEVLAKAMTRLKTGLGDAGSGGDKFREALASLGIKADEFVKLNMTDQVAALSDAYLATGQDAEGFAATLDLIGLRGADLIPVLQMGSEEIKAMIGGMTIVSEEQMNAMKKADDAIASFTATVKANIAGVVADAFIFAKTQLDNFITSMQEMGARSVDPGGIARPVNPAKPKDVSGAREAARSADEVFGIAEDRLKIEKELAATKAKTDADKQARTDAWGLARAELAILEAQAKGEADKAKEMERQLKIRQDIKALMAAGMNERQATDIANRTDAATRGMEAQAAEDAAFRAAGVTRVGDMRSIGGGGGVVGIDYARQQVDLQRETVRLLGEVVRANTANMTMGL